MIAPAILVLSVRWLAFVSGLALALSGECQPLFLGVFGGFFVLGLIINRQQRLARVMGKLQPFLALLMLAIAFIDFFKLSNSFLLAIAHFLLSVQGLRLLALQTPRENLGSVLLSSLMMLSAATLSVDWTYFALFVVFILTVIWALMLHTLLEESHRNAAITAAPLPLPRFVPFIRVSALAAFGVAFGCCVVVFVVFPRFNFQGFRGQFLQPVRKTGFTSQVNLAGGGSIFNDDSVVMRIEIKPADRNLWTGYIRGQALDEFRDGVWRRSSGQSPTRAYRTSGREMNLRPNERHRGRALHQRVYLESMDTPLLFAAPSPVLLSIDRPYVDVFSDGAVQRISGDTWRVRYDVDSIPSALDPASAPSSRFSKKKKNQPEKTKAASSIAALAGNVTREANSSFEKAQRVAAYLQKNFTYSLDGLPAAQRGEDAVENFLFQTKRGHCEYFASAMCLMLRAVGVPARMATGFLSREWNSRGNYMVVRMRHAHAWVEAQMEDGTWIGFDPSPRDVDAPPTLGLLGNWSQAMDYLNLRWNRYILSYDFERQVQVVQSVTNATGSLSGRLGRWRRWSVSLKGWTTHGMRTPFGLGTSSTFLRMADVRVTLAVFVAAVLVWLLWRRRSRPRIWFYPKLVRALERRTGRNMGEETLRDFAAKNAGALAPHTDLFRFLIDAYYALRFSDGRVSVDTAAVRTALIAIGCK
jgi:transglutaminase-like putative cysteine protease